MEDGRMNPENADSVYDKWPEDESPYIPILPDWWWSDTMKTLAEIRRHFLERLAETKSSFLEPLPLPESAVPISEFDTQLWEALRQCPDWESLLDNARPTRPRDRNWSAQEELALLNLKAEALEVELPGTDWGYISGGLRDRHSFDRKPKCCENKWGTLLKTYKRIQYHQNSLDATRRVSYWEMNAQQKYKCNLPQSFSEEAYNVMERIIASKCQRKGERQRRRSISYNFTTDGSEEMFADEDNMWPHPIFEESYAAMEPAELREANPYLLMPPAHTFFGPPHIGEGSGTSRFRPRIPDDQFATKLAPLFEDAVNFELARLRYDESNLDENDDSVASLATCLTPVVIRAVGTSAVDDEGAPIAISDPKLKQLIAEEVRTAIKPISDTLLAKKLDDQMFEQKKRVLDKKKRALAREEQQLLKRQRVANQLRPARKHQGRATLPSLQALNITSAEDSSHEADSGLFNMLM